MKEFLLKQKKKAELIQIILSQQNGIEHLKRYSKGLEFEYKTRINEFKNYYEKQIQCLKEKLK